MQPSGLCGTMGLTLDATELTHDAFLGGLLHLWQPRTGYRAGIDPVLLAASVPAQAGQDVLDLGCGAGAAALCLGARVADLNLLGLERQADYAELARRNGLDCMTGDVDAMPRALRQKSFDHVICNPPYFDRSAGDQAENAGRETAMGERTPLKVWVSAAARRLRPKGYLHLIHQTSRLPDLLAACSGRLGAIEVLPLAARVGRAPERIILRARKEGKAAFRLHAPRILHAGAAHETDGDDYVEEVSDVLRRGFALKW